MDLRFFVLLVLQVKFTSAQNKTTGPSNVNLTLEKRLMKELGLEPWIRNLHQSVDTIYDMMQNLGTDELFLTEKVEWARKTANDILDHFVLSVYTMMQKKGLLDNNKTGNDTIPIHQVSENETELTEEMKEAEDHYNEIVNKTSTFLTMFETEIFSSLEKAISKTVESRLDTIKNDTKFKEKHDLKGKPVRAKEMCRRFKTAIYNNKLDKCFIEVKKPTSYLEALTNCTTRNWNFAYPKSLIELEFLNEIRSNQSSHYHIGILKFHHKTGVEYKSVDKKIMIGPNSALWSKNEPNPTESLELSVIINATTGRMADSRPGNYPYFCTYS